MPEDTFFPEARIRMRVLTQFIGRLPDEFQNAFADEFEAARHDNNPELALSPHPRGPAARGQGSSLTASQKEN